jgi:hypothetical protein
MIDATFTISPGSRRDHGARGGACAQERPSQVDRQNFVPVAKHKIDSWSSDRSPGVVDKNVEATLLGERRPDHRVHAGLVGDVGDDCGQMQAQRTHFRRRALSGALVQVCQYDACARQRQRLRGLPANSAGAPSDDRNATVETHQTLDIHHRALRRSGNRTSLMERWTKPDGIAEIGSSNPIWFNQPRIDCFRPIGIYWLKRAKNGQRKLRGESVFRRED